MLLILVLVLVARRGGARDVEDETSEARTGDPDRDADA
jgi:hypothetical protein